MTRKTHSLRHAGTAITAVLALASTPSVAQAIAAEIPAAPAPVPEPVIVVPDIPPPAASEATVQSIEATTPEAIEAAEPGAAPPATTARTRAAPVAPAAPAPEPRIAAPEPAAVDAAPVAPVAAIAPAAEPVAPVAESEPLAGNANDDIGILALALGGLAILALAIWGFVAIGRRKPVRRYATEAPSVVPPAPVAVDEPAVAERPVERSPNVASFAPHPGALPHTGAAVALPRSVPESFEEREALFRRMVDARPDRANPFTDRRMRMKRARLILQSLGRDFGDAEPWIDLSQYPNNWPELARKRSAAA